ncbi:MAG: acyl-CoA thioesterase [Rhodocyclaceae bacterium]|nr:acyl-CoA thioesterase [Rhodocyclaceae bacterium]
MHNKVYPEDRQPALRVVPMPCDLNPSGDVFGGWVMSLVDVAGAMPARRRARGRVTTVAVKSFVFRHPVAVGDLVSFYADVVSVGRTSLTVNVDVWAERQTNDGTLEHLKVTEATLTYVALTEDGEKRVIDA